MLNVEVGSAEILRHCVFALGIFIEKAGATASIQLFDKIIFVAFNKSSTL